MATIEFEGREYVLSKQTVGDVRYIQEELRKALHPLNLIKPHLEGLEPSERLALLEKAQQQADGWTLDMRSRAAREWLEGVQGVVIFLWLSVHKRHPEFTYEMAKRCVENVELDIAKQKLDDANDLGNAAGRDG